MGRTKSAGGGKSSGGAEGGTLSPQSSDSSGSSSQPAEAKMKDLLKVLHKQCLQIQQERDRGEHNLVNISKTHDRLQQEQKVTPYYKSKLKSLYTTAMQDASAEAEILRSAMKTITEIKNLRDSRRQEASGVGIKPIMRRGVLMSLLSQNALSLPLWVSKPGEKPPPLCGAVPPDPQYVCSKKDKVAAKVKADDGEENWILAEVESYNPTTKTYTVVDIDSDDGREHASRNISSSASTEQQAASKYDPRHPNVPRRRVAPLPAYRANPETDPGALFPKDTVILALYPQTTCFYRGIVESPPAGPQEDYSILFEDHTYPEGYSPPLMVAQRYVIAWRDDKRKS